MVVFQHLALVMGTGGIILPCLCGRISTFSPGYGHRRHSSVVNVPGDVLPGSVYFFGILVLSRVCFLAILVHFSQSNGYAFWQF